MKSYTPNPDPEQEKVMSKPWAVVSFLAMHLLLSVTGALVYYSTEYEVPEKSLHWPVWAIIAIGSIGVVLSGFIAFQQFISKKHLDGFWRFVRTDPFLMALTYAITLSFTTGSLGYYLARAYHLFGM